MKRIPRIEANQKGRDDADDGVAATRIREDKSVVVTVTEEDDGDGKQQSVAVYRLELNGVTVELCSLGASITRLLLPASSGDNVVDDVVLGFDSIQEMWKEQNPPYFGVVAGRVANRIKEGRFQTQPNGPVYQLDVNNGPNHLHGGWKGFSNRIWDAKRIVKK